MFKAFSAVINENTDNNGTVLLFSKTKRKKLKLFILLLVQRLQIDPIESPN